MYAATIYSTRKYLHAKLLNKSTIKLVENNPCHEAKDQEHFTPGEIPIVAVRILGTPSQTKQEWLLRE